MPDASARESIAFSVGNTSISVARVRSVGGEVRATPVARWAASLNEDAVWNSDAQSSLAKLVCGAESSRWYVVSTNPAALATLRLVASRFGADLRVLGQEVPIPLRLAVRSPGTVGHDRLVNAFAAWRMTGSDAMVLDFGTALSTGVVIDGCFVGGAIAPGRRLMLDALARGAAQLPQLSADPSVLPPSLIGDETTVAMRCGVIAALAGAAQTLVEAARSSVAPRHLACVVTGGDAEAVLPLLRLANCHHEPFLTHRGVALAAWDAGE